MKLKKSDLYSSLWAGADQLRGSMDASQYKDYVLAILFVKYVSDKAKSGEGLIEIPEGGSFDDLVSFKNQPDIGDKMNKAIRKLADANGLHNIIDTADFNDEQKLGKDKEMVDTLTGLVGIFESNLDFSGSSSDDDDLLGDAYEYLMKQFATESGKSKGQFYTPAEVSRTMAQLLKIPVDTPKRTTAYDPACGSGSLLLKLINATNNGLTLYGQEKDNATRSLAVMNMYLHGVEDADVKQGNTIADPQFLDNGRLKTFDYVVANPPFSLKNWANGMSADREYGRFDGYGMPPDKNGDYAFLLHIIKSMKSDGRGAVILPHGVLFRGNAEAEIRKNIIDRGLIEAIIGLPANLFFGTGIPACIILLDKRAAETRDGIFMIDASRGFIKDGSKNRLREQDIKKITDTYLNQTEIAKYSRFVPNTEIKSDKNAYNLNIPRYIDTADAEDIQDLQGHYFGGIPEGDLDVFADFWAMLPQVKSKLFYPDREGFVNLATDKDKIIEVLNDDADYRQVKQKFTQAIDDFLARHAESLSQTDSDTNLKELIANMTADLLSSSDDLPLVGKYDAYDQLTNYWLETLQDDLLLVKQNGWVEAIAPRKPRVIGKTDKGKDKFEDATISVGSGKSAKKYVMDILPPELIVSAYFERQKSEKEAAESALESAASELTEFIEENTGEDGLLGECMNDKDEVKEATAKARAKELKGDANADIEEQAAIKKVLELFDAEKEAKKNLKQLSSDLDEMTVKKYSDLDEPAVKKLLITDKWSADIKHAITGEFNAEVTHLTHRLSELAERYSDTLPALESRAKELNAKVQGYLEQLGVKL